MTTITLTPENFEEFCQRCLDPNRVDPFLLVTEQRSPAGSLRFPLARIRECIGDDVLIYVAPPEMFDRLRTFADGRFEAHDGALRIVTLGRPHDDFMVGHTEESREEAFRYLAQRFQGSATRLRTARTAMSKPSVRQTVTATPADIVPRHLDHTGPQVSNVVWSSETTKPTTCTACHCADCLADERALHERIERLERQVQGLERRLAVAMSRTAETATTPAPSLSVVYTDPEKQARYEIEQTWLTRYDEERRSEFPLREYAFGPHFVASLTDNTFTVATHAQMLAACVDVITGAVYGISTRSAHPASGAGQPAPWREDGAIAYRATVNTGPGGARIVWWRRTDGTAELMKIAHHDDYRLD